MKSTSPDPSFEYEKLNIVNKKLLDNEILNALPSSVIITDLEGHICFMNRFLDIWLVQDWIETGTNLSAVLEASQNPPLIQPSDFLLSVQDEIYRFGESSGVLSLVNGAQTQYSVRRIKLNRLVWTFTDTSSIKRTEEFAEFYLDLMGHDIRNRLQEVMLYIEILKAGSNEQDDRDILSPMSSAILRCGNLIKKIKIGQERGDIEKIYGTRDGGLQESTLTRYFVQPNIMIEVSFDSTGGPWSPENKVIDVIHVHNENLHID